MAVPGQHAEGPFTVLGRSTGLVFGGDWAEGYSEVPRGAAVAPHHPKTGGQGGARGVLLPTGSAQPRGRHRPPRTAAAAAAAAIPACPGRGGALPGRLPGPSPAPSAQPVPRSPPPLRPGPPSEPPAGRSRPCSGWEPPLGARDPSPPPVALSPPCRTAPRIGAPSAPVAPLPGRGLSAPGGRWRLGTPAVGRGRAACRGVPRGCGWGALPSPGGWQQGLARRGAPQGLRRSGGAEIPVLSVLELADLRQVDTG